MTVLIVQGQAWEAFAEAFERLRRNEQLETVQRLVPIAPSFVDRKRSQPVPRRTHHDQFIQRHIRSVQR